MEGYQQSTRFSRVPQQFSDVEDNAQYLVNGLYLFGANHSPTR